jgi:hypothetical protein
VPKPGHECVVAPVACQAGHNFIVNKILFLCVFKRSESCGRWGDLAAFPLHLPISPIYLVLGSSLIWQDDKLGCMFAKHESPPPGFYHAVGATGLPTIKAKNCLQYPATFLAYSNFVDTLAHLREDDQYGIVATYVLHFMHDVHISNESNTATQYQLPTTILGTNLHIPLSV